MDTGLDVFFNPQLFAVCFSNLAYYLKSINMAQGKLKVKTKLPAAAKKKANKSKKGPAIQKRGNAPVQPKKTKLQETQKLKKMISKTVNTAVEDELRGRALDGRKTLTKKTSKSQKKK